MDQFKEHIQQRVNELDIDVPRENVWQAIKQEVKPVKANAKLLYMKWVVAACVIALTGFGGYMLVIKPVAGYKLPATSLHSIKPSFKVQELKIKTQESVTNDQKLATKNQVTRAKIHESTNQLLAAKKPTANSQQLSTSIASLNQIENTFKQVINLQKAKVNTTPLNAESPGYFNDFTIEMKRMERDEQGVKKDISKSGLTDELLEQLINIYQQKLNMLKQLQNEIHKTNNRFKQNRMPSDTSKTYFLNI